MTVRLLTRLTLALALVSFAAQQWAGISKYGIAGHFHNLIPPGLPVWHPSVEPYEVFEAGQLVGRIYLDMHPRAGKGGGGATAATVLKTSLIAGDSPMMLSKL